MEAAPPPFDETPWSDAPVATVQPARLVFGLTGSQFMVVLVVFVTALVTFSWALSSVQAAKP